MNQGAAAVATVHLIESLKLSTRFPWLTRDTDALNRVVSFGVAFMTAVGFTFAMTGSFHEGGSLTITFPSMAKIGMGVAHALLQSGAQQLYYKNAVKG